MSANNPICAENCEDQELPEVLFSDCAPEVNQAQVKNIYIGKRNQPFTDWSNAAEWAARLAATDDTKIIQLTVIGDKPRPTANEKKISHDRIIKGTKDHVLNLVIDETNLVNYDGLVRQLECNGQFSLWYDSGDTKYMNGGNDGIDASIGFDDVITASTSDDEQFIGEAKWSSKFTPERELNPIAA